MSLSIKYYSKFIFFLSYLPAIQMVKLCLRRVFRDYLVNGGLFGNSVVDTKRVFCFPLQLLSEIFHSLKN